MAAWLREAVSPRGHGSEGGEPLNAKKWAVTEFGVDVFGACVC